VKRIALNRVAGESDVGRQRGLPPEQGCVPIWCACAISPFVSSGDGYSSDDDQHCDDVAWGYFGEVQISGASGSVQLEETAKVVLSLMKEWAKEQLEPSLVAA
jgi:hypothetical protein